jgi:hypothetical protein
MVERVPTGQHSSPHEHGPAPAFLYAGPTKASACGSPESSAREIGQRLDPHLTGHSGPRPGPPVPAGCAPPRSAHHPGDSAWHRHSAACADCLQGPADCRQSPELLPLMIFSAAKLAAGSWASARPPRPVGTVTRRTTTSFAGTVAGSRSAIAVVVVAVGGMESSSETRSVGRRLDGQASTVRPRPWLLDIRLDGLTRPTWLPCPRCCGRLVWWGQHGRPCSRGGSAGPEASVAGRDLSRLPPADWTGH